MLDSKTAETLREELGTEVFQLLAETFFADFPDRLFRLAALVVSEDRSGLEAEAFSVRGAASNIGLNGLAVEAEDVARHARAGGWDGVREALSRLHAAALACAEELAAEFAIDVSCGECAPFAWDADPGQ